MEIPNKKQLKFSVLLTNKDIKANKLLLFLEKLCSFSIFNTMCFVFYKRLFCVFWGILFCFLNSVLPLRCCYFCVRKAARLGGAGNVLQFMCSICCSPLSVIRHRWHRLSCLQVWRSRYPFRSRAAITFDALERVRPISLAISPARRLSLLASMHSNISSFMFMLNVFSTARSNSITARKMLYTL